jgi:hypothetical protein
VTDLASRIAAALDGDRYLRFVFAEGGTCEEVQQALAAARWQLRVVIG